MERPADDRSWLLLLFRLGGFHAFLLVGLYLVGYFGGLGWLTDPPYPFPPLRPVLVVPLLAISAFIGTGVGLVQYESCETLRVSSVFARCVIGGALTGMVFTTIALSPLMLEGPAGWYMIVSMFLPIGLLVAAIGTMTVPLHIWNARNEPC